MNYANKFELDKISAYFREHDGVEDAIVTVEEITPSNRVLVAYVVPDTHHAGEVRRACELETDGSLKDLSLYEPDKNLLVAQKNRTETDFLFREIFLDNAYLRHGIQLTENACVLDVGANIGMFAIFVAKKSPRARIFSIEPVFELSQAVKANAKIHNADITVINCALGSQSGYTDFTYYPNNTVMSSRFADESEDRETLRAYLTTEESTQNQTLLDKLIADRMVGQRQQCAVMTLNQIVEQYDIKRIDLLKIDVEKAEMDVLSGINESTWGKISQIIIEVHDIAGRVADIQKMLQARGFIVSYDRDHRLSKTNCFTVYGYLDQAQRNDQNIVDNNETPKWPSRQSLADDLTSHAKKLFPEHIIPEHFVLLNSIPLTADGNVDFNKLKEIRAKRQDAVYNDLEPQTPTEKSLAKIWHEIFGKSNATVDSDFFEFGGNSLTAVRLIARVEAIFGENVLSPDALFENGQLGQLAAIIDSALNERKEVLT
jgi:FkbM family methyltransferase